MYSFDIFDTLITRNTISPYGIFLIMQEQIKKKNTQSEYLSNHFAELRFKAEKNARDFADSTEISLKDIYIELSKMSYLTDEEIQQLMSFEVQTEIDCAVEIKSNVKKVLELYEKGDTVVLISDMYLSASDIKRILIKIHPLFDKLKIYVSSEYHCTKREGLLYVKVRNIEGAAYNNWTHYGDNYISDVCIPSTLGIMAVHAQLSELPPWEKALVNQFHLENDLALQAALGIAKKIRIQNNLTCAENIGLTIGGIILFPYVEWIIQQSIQLGIQHLYFIARDGFILKNIADTYIKTNHLYLKSKYIYGSRKAWRVDDSEKKEYVLQYFLQEVIFTDSKFAFVDLQGTGRSIEYLGDILKDYLNKPLTVFYYSMARPTKNPKCNFRIFNTNDRSRIIELLGRAPHGATIGYEYANQKYIPKLEQQRVNQTDIERLNGYLHGVSLFAVEASRFVPDFKIKLSYNHLGEFLLKYCTTNPNPQVSDFFGEIPFDAENIDESKKYAPKLSRKNIFQIYMWKTNESEKQYYSGTDLGFSLLRMNQKEKKLFMFCQRNYSRIFGKIVHNYKKIVGYNERHIEKKKVIIYAAGKFGKELYRQLQYSTEIKVIGWTDVNYKEYKSFGYSLRSLSEVLQLDYDLLIIAIRDKRKIVNIKQWLVEAGAHSERIMDGENFLEMYFRN